MSAAALERMMKLQDVILKAMAKKISWLEAAEIAGVMRPDDAADAGAISGVRLSRVCSIRREGKRSTHRVPMETAEEVLRLYREVYFDLNMRHFHEKLREEHEIELSYTWVQQGAAGSGAGGEDGASGGRTGAGGRGGRMPGMLLHIDGSKHRWLNDDRWHDLIVILDDATSEIYYAQLVEEESTRTVMAGCGK